jgi:pre-mRNA-splicing factor ATP-dependent RNA helicase DHX15/PRP43
VVSSARSHSPLLPLLTLIRRLLEYAADYYDVKTFPQGETRRALERVMQGGGKKNTGSKSGGDEGRERKKRKKDKSGR